MRRTLPGLWAGLFLLLHLLPAAGVAACAWGVDAPAYLPRAGLAAFGVAGLLLLVPGFRSAVARGIARAAQRLPSGGLGAGALLALAGGACFVLFPARAHLLGDGLLHLADAHRLSASMEPWRGITWANNNAPLANAALYALLRAAGPDAAPETIFRWLGGGCGVLYLFLAGPVAHRLGRGAAGRAGILAFLATAGFVPLFAGYVELYAPLFPLLLVYLAAGTEAARGGRGAALVAAAALGVTVPFHLATASLLPSLAVAGAVAPGTRGARAVRAVGLPLVAVAVAGAVFVLIGFDVMARLGSPEPAHRLPLLAEPTFRQAYRLLDPRHFADLLWQIVLTAPAAVLALPWILRGAARPPWESAFLGAATLFPLLFVFVANPEVGAFRDWDAFAFAALPLTLWAGIRMGADPPPERIVLVAGLALVHTLAWGAVLASPSAGAQRFRTLLTSCPVSAHALSYGWETLGTHEHNEGRVDDAAEAFERALAAVPDNPRHWASAGRLHLQAGRTERAERCFREQVRLDPGSGEGWFSIGAIRAGAGDLAAAAEAFSRAAAAEPRFAMAWYQLGAAEMQRGNREAGRAAFRRFLELEPAGPRADEVRRVLGGG